MYSRSLKQCPLCGHVPKAAILEEVEVQLVKRDGRRKKPRKKPAAPSKVVNARVFQTYGNRNELEKIAAEYGYNPYVVTRWEKLYENAWQVLAARRDRSL